MPNEPDRPSSRATGPGAVVLPDDADRERAMHETGTTMFVDAGAGAGKTRVMVERICQLVAEGVPIRQIAAVTFTESAASELRDRIRARLAEVAGGCEDVAADRAAVAVADLDAAAIGTLHSFARRILAEHPIEAGLPPVVTVLDEVASSVRTNRWWNGVRAELLNDASLSAAFQLLGALGMKVTSFGRRHALEELALRLQSDWDLLEDNPLPTATLPQRVDITDVTRTVNQLAEMAQHCMDPGDSLLAALARLQEWGRRLAVAEDLSEQFQIWTERPSCRLGNKGKKANWPDVGATRALARTLGETADPFPGVIAQAIWRIAARVGDEVLAAAEQRRRDGMLLYQDLLVLARRLLRADPAVRQELHDKYPRLLLDEFQDTDPIQIELAVRIAAGAGATAADWRDVEVPAGSLFVVGDAKQSIYRFRRADIAAFMAASAHLGSGDNATLTTNFRSHREVLTWINDVFAELIVHEPDVQPGFTALQPTPTREHPSGQPRVFQLQAATSGSGAADPKPTTDDLRADEARQVADVIATALTQEWPMPEGRSIAATDITVLVPSRNCLDVLEASLRSAGVPYRLMARSLIYGSDAIRDLLLVLRAVDDPADELLLIQALRTPILACGDDDLLSWHAAGGTWSPWKAAPPSLAADHPVAMAMRLLDELRGQRRTLTASQLLAQIVSRRRLLAVAAVGVDSRDVWHRYRIVIDQARQWAETAHGSLREYLMWAYSQATDEDRANDLQLPELDSDAVTVMTIHAAKGLEFGMVIVAGMATRIPSDVGRVLWDERGAQVCLRVGSRQVGLQTLAWEDLKRVETAKLEAEIRRLLYVACTRAKEYLVVSTLGESKSRGDLLAALSAVANTPVWEFRAATWRAEHTTAEVEILDETQWRSLHAKQRVASEKRATVSAGAIAHREVPEPAGLLPPGLAKNARDLELPAWEKGRYGTAIGRAVHATLQTIDLTSGEGLVGAARAQALVEGVADQDGAVIALTRSAFDSPVVREAANREHQKETFVGGVFDDTIVEGVIDLLFTDERGDLVVVDYKTDGEPDAAAVTAYQRQLAVYAGLLHQSTRLRVARRVLVFCRERGGAVLLEV